MKWFAAFILLSLLLAVVKALLVAMAIALALVLSYAFIRRPRDTLVFLVTVTLSGLATAQPLAAIIALCLVALVAVLRPRLRRRRQLLLMHGSRSHRN